MNYATEPDPALHGDKRSPLLRVLAQIRWPVMSGFSADSVADHVAERIARQYPLRESSQELGFLVTPGGGVTQHAGANLHRFSDGAGNWTVTFADTFVTLETDAYISHDDFISRFVEIAGVVREFLPLQRWDRFGYRYTNRFSESHDVVALPRLFDPAMVSILNLGNVVQSVSETVYKDDQTSLLVRAAYLPPGASIEPTIPPSPTEAWLLDLDAFADGPSIAFSDAQLANQAQTLAAKAREFFEKVTTNEYRTRFAT